MKQLRPEKAGREGLREAQTAVHLLLQLPPPPPPVKLLHLFLLVVSFILSRKEDIFSGLKSIFNLSPDLSKVSIILGVESLVTGSAHPSVSGSVLRSREIHDLLILGKQATAPNNDRCAKKRHKGGDFKRPVTKVQNISYN